jgi:hypothetical protein
VIAIVILPQLNLNVGIVGLPPQIDSGADDIDIVISIVVQIVRLGRIYEMVLCCVVGCVVGKRHISLMKGKAELQQVVKKLSETVWVVRSNVRCSVRCSCRSKAARIPEGKWSTFVSCCPHVWA